MSLSYEEVAQIIKMIDNSNCDEVNIEIDGIKILVRNSNCKTNVIEVDDSKKDITIEQLHDLFKVASKGKVKVIVFTFYQE